MELYFGHLPIDLVLRHVNELVFHVALHIPRSYYGLDATADVRCIPRNVGAYAPLPTDAIDYFALSCYLYGSERARRNGDILPLSNGGRQSKIPCRARLDVRFPTCLAPTLTRIKRELKVFQGGE